MLPYAQAPHSRAHALLPGQRHGCHVLRMPKRFALESVNRPAAVVHARTCVFVCVFVCLFVSAPPCGWRRQRSRAPSSGGTALLCCMLLHVVACRVVVLLHVVL